MENNNETRAVFINAGENRVMLNPLKGQWEHKGKKVNLWFDVPNGAREFVVDALQKTMMVNDKGQQVMVNSNVIIWEMPTNLMVLNKNAKNEWYFTVTINDDGLEEWLDMVTENVRPKGAISEKNEPVISDARAKLQEKLAQIKKIDEDFDF
jgi:hypothetical protein